MTQSWLPWSDFTLCCYKEENLSITMFLQPPRWQPACPVLSSFLFFDVPLCLWRVGGHNMLWPIFCWSERVLTSKLQQVCSSCRCKGEPRGDPALGQGEGRSSQIKITLTTNNQRTKTWHFNKPTAFTLQGESFFLKVYFHTSNESHIFMRAMKVNCICRKLQSLDHC